MPYPATQTCTRPSTYEQLKESEEFAFVVTDIQDSTELSQQDPLAFQQASALFCQPMLPPPFQGLSPPLRSHSATSALRYL